jgi:hypothetical protein
MADTCTNLVRGKALRVTQVDACGTPVLTTGSQPVMNVSKGFVSVGWANEVDDGTEVAPKNADDEFCFIIPGCPTIKWLNVTLVFCGVDPFLFTLMTGWPLVLDEDGGAIGFRGQRTVTCDTGTAVEVWTGSKPSGTLVCDPDQPLVKYGYFALPWVTAAMVSDLSVENKEVSFTIVGKAIAGGNWGVGPNVIERRSATLEPLADVIGPEDTYHFQVTTLPPPAAVCGQYPTAFVSTVTTGAALLVTLHHTFVPGVSIANVIHWGDGSTSAGPVVTGGAGVTHTYAAAGSYLVTVVSTLSGAENYALAIAAP